MKNNLQNIIRLGKIAFINNSPIYYALESGIVSAPCHIVEGLPSQLNGLLSNDQLDMGPISSLEYGRHYKDYLLLPHLSISSYGPVGSVILFSKVPIKELDGCPVLITSASGTSQMLLRLALEEYGVFPHYIEGEIHENLLEEEVVAGLTIGDLALRLKNNKHRFPYYLDLGEVWTGLTGLPFVFAVWAVKKALYTKCPETIHAVHRALLDSKTWGLNHLEAISHHICSRANISPSQCKTYLQKLIFDFEEIHQQGLLLFFSHLSQRGVLQSPVMLEFMEDIKESNR